jgi:hypothetical protein
MHDANISADVGYLVTHSIDAHARAPLSSMNLSCDAVNGSHELVELGNSHSGYYVNRVSWAVHSFGEFWSFTKLR